MTADPEGLMIEINKYDPHIASGSTPRVTQLHSGFLLSEMGVSIVYFKAVYVKY